MQHRLFLSLVFPMSLLLVACSSGPSMSPGEQYLSDARTGLKSSDFNAALKNLDGAIKSAGDDPLGQQAALLRVALMTALSDAGKQLAEAYALGVKEPPAQSRSGAFNKMRADYYGIARSRLMDAMQSVMDRRSKLSGNAMPIEVTFPGFTGGTDPTVTKIKSGQWAADADRVAAETRLDRNALARILSALAGAGQDAHKSQQLFTSGKVDIDPRVYLVELSSSFLQIGSMFDPRGTNQPDQLRIVNQVVRGNLDVALKLLATKPDKDLEARVKKMQADCDKALKKLGG
ncbi:MAG: hypothetical protein AUH86_21210 [Acidobacteria bacterium 13_1_40CM_4_58_4]|nr:MAG: hypothetical protein AUH86_21210 [Acidobacteria bacterium 13_1_40CM_4_58_4]